MAYILPSDWEVKDFYREHADSLYRSCMFLTGGQADAQAMMKEIFLKMLNKGIHFSSSADAKAWLILCAYKMRKKAMRDYANGKNIPAEIPSSVEEVSQAVEAVAEEVIVDENPSIQEDASASKEEVPNEPSIASEETVTEKSEDISSYPDQLMKLSAKARLVALLYYCEGYRKTEIGKYLGCPTFVVRFRLALIRRRLRSGLGGE